MQSSPLGQWWTISHRNGERSSLITEMRNNYGISVIIRIIQKHNQGSKPKRFYRNLSTVSGISIETPMIETKLAFRKEKSFEIRSKWTLKAFFKFSRLPGFCRKKRSKRFFQRVLHYKCQVSHWDTNDRKHTSSYGKIWGWTERIINFKATFPNIRTTRNLIQGSQSNQKHEFVNWKKSFSGHFCNH